MEWRKIKNIIILILLLVNGFLLFLVLGQQFKVRQYRSSAVTRAVQVLEQNGVSLSAELLRGADISLQPLSAVRSTQAEADMAQSLLGPAVQFSDQGGGVSLYTSELGSGQFLSSGEFSFTLTDHLLNGQSPADHAAKLLASLGLSAELVETQTLDTGASVTFLQLLDGSPLYSSPIVFQYSETHLSSVSGTLLTGSAPAESADLLDIPTALIRFLDGILARGDVCSAISGMRPGYRASQTFGSGIRLTPVWLVSTNVSDYYLNAITGELSLAD